MNVVLRLLLAVTIVSAPLIVSPPAQAATRPLQGTKVTTQAAWGDYMESLANILYRAHLSNEGPKPNYDSAGVFLTAFEYDNDYWMHPVPENRLSLTYSHITIATRPFGFAGLVFWPGSYAPRQAFPLAMHCAYPVDGMTIARSDSGCGVSQGEPKSMPCQDQGIYTAPQWIKVYNPTTDVDFFGICGFKLTGSDPANTLAAKSVIDIILTTDLRSGGLPWNEFVIHAWPEDDPSRVPVLGFFYVRDVQPLVTASAAVAALPDNRRKRSVVMEGAEALASAQAQQLAFYNKTKLFAPVLSIEGIFPAVTYRFHPEDQNPTIPSQVTVLQPM